MSKVEIVPNFVDTSLFRPSRKIPGTIAFVGRLAPEKNVDVLIRAMTCLPWAYLHVIGDGPERYRLHELWRQFDIKVAWHGALANETVAQVLASTEFFVLPSSHDQSPKAVLEAMSCGSICVVSRQAGKDIQDGVTGFLCDPTEKGIVEALGRARMHNLHQVGQRAAYWVRQERSLAVAVEAERAILEGLCPR